jgi:hypothetical protein
VPAETAKRSDLLDPRQRFVTIDAQRPIYLRHGTAIWMVLVGVTVAVFSFVLWRAQFVRDARFYLLSAVAQVLGAVVAMAATLPLFFVTQSAYLSGCAARLVASWHFRCYVLVYSASAATSLILMALACAPQWITIAALAVAVGCLTSLLPFFAWIRMRTDPRCHMEDLISAADARARVAKDDVRENVVAANAIVKEYLDNIVAAGSVAVNSGSTVILHQTLSCVALFFMKYSSRSRPWCRNAALEALRSLTGVIADSEPFKVIAAWVYVRLVYGECVQGGLRLPERDLKELFSLVAERETAATSRVNTLSHLARAMFLLGVGAHYMHCGSCVSYAAEAVNSLMTSSVGTKPEPGWPAIAGSLVDFSGRWVRENYPTVDLADSTKSMADILVSESAA